MKIATLHPQSKALLGSWNSINGLGSDYKGKSDINLNVNEIVERLFMIQRVSEGIFVFKTAGKELKDWTGRDLLEHEIGSIFHGSDKNLIRALLEASFVSQSPAIAKIIAHGADIRQKSEIEILFLPLLDDKGPAKFLGLFQPCDEAMKLHLPVLRFVLKALIPPEAVPISQKLKLA